MNTKKITFKEVKLRQRRDLNSGVSKYYVYRHFSVPFTWIFVNLGISPNTITLSSFILCLIGFYFLSLGSYVYMILGFIFLIFFKIMDMADGEVARIQGSSSMEGVYFDRVSHYIFSICMGLGLGFGLYRLYQNDVYIIIGFAFASVFIVENAILDLLKLSVRQGVINNKILIQKLIKSDKKNIDECLQQKTAENINEGKSWQKSNILSKITAVYPFQGVIYTDTFTIPIFILIAIVESISHLFGFLVISGYIIRIVPLYMIIVSISKIIWIICFILNMKKKGYITRIIKSV